jgi:hypothetical protein
MFRLAIRFRAPTFHWRRKDVFMTFRPLAFAGVLAFLMTTTALAQVLQDAQAVTVLSSAYQAMGGSVVPTIQDTHTTVQVTGTDSNGNPVPESVTIETSGQNVNMQNLTAGVTVIVNGSQMSIATNSGTTVMPSLSLGNAGVAHLPIFSALSDWANPQVILHYIGLEQIGGTTVHHIQMQRPFSPDAGIGGYDQPLDFYIDAQSFLLLKLLYAQRAPSDLSIAVPLEADYSNYQQIAGIMVPMNLQYVSNGNVASSQVVTSFAVNQGTQPADFQVAQ